MFYISIIVPTIRPISELRTLLDSISKIKGVRIEVILVNDDKSRQLKKSDFLYYDDELTVLNNSYGKGACSARNCGLDLARGTYCHFMDDDDEFLDVSVELEDMAESDLICFNALIAIDEMKYSTRHSYMGKSMIYGNTLGGLPRFLFRKKFLLDNGLRLPQNVRKYQDLAFLGQIQKFKPIIHFTPHLFMMANYSLNHDGISSRSAFKIEAYYRSLLSFCDKSVLHADKRNVVKGFLEFQAWYLVLSRPNLLVFLRLLMFDIQERQLLTALRHLFIYVFPRLLIKIRSTL